MSFEYYIFYKPYQVLSQFSPEGNKDTLAKFFPDIAKDVYPVGRLDFDSEGMLILTNDKKLNQRLLHPSVQHEKEYWVQVEGIPTEQALLQLEKGVVININGKTYTTRPAGVQCLQPAPEVPERNPPIRVRKHIPDSWLSLCIAEGKNRQVRKMTAAVNLPTLRLLRYRIGSLTIAGMQPGEYRQISAEEKERLLQPGGSMGRHPSLGRFRS